MVVKSKRSLLSRVLVPALAGLSAVSLPVGLSAQMQNSGSFANPFWGSVMARPLTNDELTLSLDDAIRMGLQNNLGLKQAEAQELSIHGQKNQALQKFLPDIELNGEVGVHQTNLAGMGFGPGVIR